MRTNSIQRGKKAEDYTSEYLENLGYTVLYRNWRCYAGEIDIVTYKNKLIFVEVKSVSKNTAISPHELFTTKKRKNLSRTISIYLRSKGISFSNWSLDLLCLKETSSGYDVVHYENITELISRYQDC